MEISVDMMAWMALGGLALLLVMAAWIDVRTNRIPNWLVCSGMLLGLLLHIALPSGLGFNSLYPGGLGWKASLGGLTVGLVAMLPFYLLRMMGAGDVKLMAMVGAFLGAGQMPGAIVASFLAGGVLALVVALRSGMLGQVLHNIRLVFYMGAATASMGMMPDAKSATASGTKMPYGVAIALGTLIYLLWQRMT